MRTRGLAAVVGALSAAALMTSSAAGAPGPGQPDPTPTAQGALGTSVPSAVELLPAGSNVDTVRIADDAVYILERGATSSTLWRWQLTTGPAGTTVGAATAIADVRSIVSSGFGFAEHDGTVAYPRASDGRLVLRDASGAETVPDWAEADPFGHGFTALTADWLATNNDTVGGVQLRNVHTGAQVPLGVLTPVPAGYPGGTALSVAISDARAVWTGIADNGTTSFSGVFTVALDPADADGAVGDVTALVSENPQSNVYSAVGTEGGMFAWTRFGCTPSCFTNLQWYSDAPYTGTPAELVSLGPWTELGLDGTIIALRRQNSSVVEWYDLASPATAPTRTWSPPGRAVASSARFVVYRDDGAGRTWLSDATGGVVSIKPLPTDLRPGDAFFEDIIWLVNQGITGGYPDGTFRPRASVNRDAMAAFLYRMNHAGADAPDCTTAAFTDVPASHPFCGEIAWLASTGITKGYPDGTFRPGQAVTREAMAAFLSRYAHSGEDAPACTSAPFIDVPLSHPFCGEIAWMASAGVSTGWPDHTFRPGLTIERQAMAAFLHRYGAG